MSAIQRDREIAEASIGGVWSTNRRQGGGTSIDVDINADEETEHISEAAWAGDLADAEHIVRLHNRQPLYDTLVDAVREKSRNYRQGASEWLVKEPDLSAMLDDFADELDQMLAALDREEP